MSSPMPPLPPDFERAVGGAIAVAVSTVAERSFFASVDRCDPPDFDEIGTEWLVATVRFDDGPVCGSLACSLPSDLAQRLFDAFSGRDPRAPLPPRHELDDLAGEFSNMVCGTWLSRCDAQRMFRLSSPVVSRVRRPDYEGRHREWVVVNDSPVAIDWELAHRPSDAPAASSHR
jgi:hypothetical protein